MKRTETKMGLVNGKTLRNSVPLTNEMTESGSQLDLGLYERIAIVLKGNKENLFHLVG